MKKPDFSKKQPSLLNIFISYGGDELGHCQEPHHKKWALLESCSYDVHENTSREKSSASQAIFDTITVTRLFDESSILYTQLALSHYSGPCSIHFTKLGPHIGNEEFDYTSPVFQISLTDATIKSHRTYIDRSSQFETIVFNFSRVDISYFSWDDSKNPLSTSNLSHTKDSDNCVTFI